MNFEKEKHFFDVDNNSVIIKAGTDGWQILYADGNSKTVKNEASIEDNFETAFEYAIQEGTISSDLPASDQEDVE